LACRASASNCRVFNVCSITCRWPSFNAWYTVKPTARFLNRSGCGFFKQSLSVSVFPTGMRESLAIASFFVIFFSAVSQASDGSELQRISHGDVNCITHDPHDIRQQSKGLMCCIRSSWHHRMPWIIQLAEPFCFFLAASKSRRCCILLFVVGVVFRAWKQKRNYRLKAAPNCLRQVNQLTTRLRRAHVRSEQSFPSRFDTCLLRLRLL